MKDMRPMQDLILRKRTIRTDDLGRICLNDIWAAGDNLPNQKSQDWWRLDSTKRLATALLDKLPGFSRPFSKADFKAIYYAIGKPGGGTYSHPILACAYAGYLNPELEVEVRDIWLRFRAGDPTLADDVLSRASPEANRWAIRRAEARVTRSEYTQVLSDHGVAGSGYRDCTDEAYLRLFDGHAWELRLSRKLPAKANVRDSMSEIELTTIRLTEMLAGERIEEEDRRGNYECKEATGRTAKNVRSAIDNERKDRQKRLIP